MLSSNNCSNQCKNCCKKETNCVCCTKVCKTCCACNYKTEPMQIDDNEYANANNNSFITNVHVSPGSHYPEIWLKLLKNGVNNISFNQVIGNTDEPLYTVLGFFPDKLQVTIDTSLVTTDTVQTFVHRNKIIITGKKLECSTMENVAGCRELEVSRTIMIPLPMKHALSKATIMENANIYMLLVHWDLPF